MCGPEFGNMAPLKLKFSEALPLDNKNYFFSQTNKNVNGTLKLEDFNNNLVLSFKDDSPIATIYYNLDSGDYDFYNCTKIYFRMPGEHIIDGSRSDLELQLNCSGLIPGDKINTKNTFVAIPVKKVKNFEESTQFFDMFDKVQLGSSLKTESFEEILDSFNMYKRIYYYKGSASYPECSVGYNWIVVDNLLKIKEKIYTQLFSLLDPNQIVDGNYRSASDKAEDYFVLENNFSK